MEKISRFSWHLVEVIVFSRVANFQSGCCYHYSVYDLISARILLLSVVFYSSSPLSANQTVSASSTSQSQPAARVFGALSDVTSLLR